MKLNKLVSLPFFILALSISGCGGQQGGGDTSSNQDSTSQGSAYNVDPNDYTVTVLYPNGQPVGAGEARVQWCTKTTCALPKTTDANGVACYKGLAEDTYYVHLLEEIEGYTYNPNIYVATPENRQITLQLEEVKGTITSRDLKAGENAPANSGLGNYTAKYSLGEGAYNVTFEKNTHNLYFGFAPKEPGSYVLESWAVDLLASNKIDPVLGFIGNEYEFDTPLETYDNANKDTKNFSVQIDVSEDYIQRDKNGNYQGGTTFAYIMTTASADEYPASFSIKLTRIGDYNPGDSGTTKEDIECTETRPASEPGENEEFQFCEIDGTDEPVYNPTDRYYHLGTSNGPILYAALRKDLPWMDTNLYFAACTAGDSYYITDGGTKNYKPCFEGYLTLCNSEGVTPVTTELKNMLDGIQYAQVLFSHDGLNGYISAPFADGYQWLFAVGYYDQKSGLTPENPASLKENNDTLAFTMEANQTLYYVASSEYASTWTLVCENSNIEWSYEEATLTGGATPLVVSVAANGSKTFTITNKTASNLNVVIQVAYVIDSANHDLNNLKVGLNQIVVDVDNYDFDNERAYGKFIVPETASYSIKSKDEYANITLVKTEEDWDTALYPTYPETKAFALTAEQEIVIELAFNEIGVSTGTVTFEIVKK